MVARLFRAPLFPMVLVTAAASLVACGGSGGGTGGGGATNSSSSSSSGSSSSGSGGTGGGAGTGCLALCAVLNQCPGVTMSDCATDCPKVDAFNTTSGCTDKYNAEASCILAAMDQCNAAQSDCQGQVNDYVGCSSDYCTANPGTTGCP